MRRMARTDANQKAIVEGLRAVGASVAITSQLGTGFPDIVVGYRGRNYLIEIKDGDKPPSQRKLTSDEVEFENKWRGQYAIAESLADALVIIGCRVKQNH